MSRRVHLLKTMREFLVMFHMPKHAWHAGQSGTSTLAADLACLFPSGTAAHAVTSLDVSLERLPSLGTPLFACTALTTLDASSNRLTSIAGEQ